MKIAVDKKTYQVVNEKNDYVYLYDDENYKDLLKLGLHCIYYKKCNFVDINLTNYDVECLKQAKINDKDYDKLPDKINYKFAIIVPNYNNDHGSYNNKTFLVNCIESILNQKYKDFTLIIVDDCSTDTSAETYKKYEHDKRVKVIYNKRKKYNGGSRNVGIDYALNNLDFDYFCFLDSDDWWKHDNVLTIINNRLYWHELMTLGCEMLYENGQGFTTKNEATCYQDLWSLNNNLWCTAWARVIRKDKIQYFCEDTMMEDRVWTYKVADNINFENVVNLKQIVYVWNRMNTVNSVSLVRDYFWNASAYCHIGHQMQMVDTIKHREMIPLIKERIEECKRRISNGKYEQY